MANKTYEVSVKFNAHTATDTHAINARLFVMLWESRATLEDAAECEIVGISLESFDSGHLVVNEAQAEQLENVINAYLERNFEKHKSDYVLPTWNLSNLGDDNE